MPLHHSAKLTELSHGGGCGCKISPSVLAGLLKNIPQLDDDNLLTGIQTNDDAAVYRLDENRLLVATTDFFPPQVDDPFDFGRIAAANAISDIYAMGATPALALNILGMPVDKLNEKIIGEILRGGQDICNKAQCIIAGGHSLDSAEPFYGLVAIGFVEPSNVKYNATAQADDVLILGKPLGIGVLSNALKKGKLNDAVYAEMIHWATKLNSVGPTLAKLNGVHMLSDVTGFGLLGHLMEVCKPANLVAQIKLTDIPMLESAVALAHQGCVTGAGQRNLSSVEKYVTMSHSNNPRQILLSDPQTNGGLLVACRPNIADQVLDCFSAQNFTSAQIIGTLEHSEHPRIVIR